MQFYAHNNATHPIVLWWCNEHGVQIKGSKPIAPGKGERINTMSHHQFVIRTKPEHFIERPKMLQLLTVTPQTRQYVAQNCIEPTDEWPPIGGIAPDRQNRNLHLAMLEFEKKDQIVQQKHKLAAEEQKGNLAEAKKDLSGFATKYDFSTWYGKPEQGPGTAEDYGYVEEVFEQDDEAEAGGGEGEASGGKAAAGGGQKREPTEREKEMASKLAEINAAAAQSKQEL